jgi:hypothetical protein
MLLSVDVSDGVIFQFLGAHAHSVERPHWCPTNAQQHSNDLDLRWGTSWKSRLIRYRKSAHTWSGLLSLQTDVLPALSMCLEPPESGLLSRPPRNVRKERLVNGRLILHAYVFLGIIESLCAMTM